MSAEITYSGNDVLEIGKGYKTFTAVFKDSAGVVLTDIVPAWNIALDDSSLLPYVLSDDADDYIKLKVTEPTMAGESISLSLSDSDHIATASISLEVLALG
jgi:hypothetical protein